MRSTRIAPAENTPASSRSGGSLRPLRSFPEPFTEQNRFLNSTLKMVRGRIEQAYGPRIAALYTAEGRDICTPENRSVILALLPDGAQEHR